MNLRVFLELVLPETQYISFESDPFEDNSYEGIVNVKDCYYFFTYWALRCIVSDISFNFDLEQEVKIPRTSTSIELVCTRGIKHVLTFCVLQPLNLTATITEKAI
jgi:hypothetical protein